VEWVPKSEVKVKCEVVTGRYTDVRKGIARD
jgi:hypothetical protein